MTLNIERACVSIHQEVTNASVETIMLEMVSIVNLEDVIMELLEEANLMIVKVRSLKLFLSFAGATNFTDVYKGGYLIHRSINLQPSKMIAVSRFSLTYLFIYSILFKDLPSNSMCRDDACKDFVCRTGFWYVFEVGKFQDYQCGTVKNPRTCYYPTRLANPTILFSKENQVFSPSKHDQTARTSEVTGPIFRNNFCEDYNECDDTTMFHDPNDNPGLGFMKSNQKRNTRTHKPFSKMVIHRCFQRMVDVTKRPRVLIYPVVIDVHAMMVGSVMDYYARPFNVRKVFMAQRKNVILFNRHGQLIFFGYFVYNIDSMTKSITHSLYDIDFLKVIDF